MDEQPTPNGSHDAASQVSTGDSVALVRQTPQERRWTTVARTPQSGDGRTYTFEGFDDFTDIVDYIIQTTYRIWDKKNIGLIYKYYTPTTVVHTSDGDTFGRDQVIINSLTKMAAFPDIRDFVEDVVWTGNDQDGYRTSMRWTWTATNTGHSIYGPPTGKKVKVSGIANCIVQGEHIVQEWVAYNEMSLLRQLGLDPFDVLRQQAARGGSFLQRDSFGEADRLDGQEAPPEMPPRTASPDQNDSFDIEDFVRRSTHDIWNRRMFGEIDRYYAPNYLCHTASDRELYGTGDFKQDVLARVAAFPDAAIHIDDLYWNDDGNGRYRTAVLWSLIGTHLGPSVYGPPTGRRVRILGITNHIVENGRFIEEWTEYGEFNLLKQLYGPQIDASPDASITAPIGGG